MTEQSPPNSELLYRRELPGGGYVDVQSSAGEALVRVERRADPSRRDGHEAPIIASTQGTSQSVFKELLAIASDNVEIARALLRWGGRVRL